MSVLETPRIYFRGQISWDPIVTNNVAQFYNEVTSETVFPAATDRVAAFRKEAIDAVAPPVGNWNPHGTHRSTFFDVSISGADRGSEASGADPFIGSPANFTGMLVDLEPYGSSSSQLFFDTMSFGIEGGYQIKARRFARMTARYVNFDRNAVGYRAGVGSVIWQTCFAKEDPEFTVAAFDSPVLQALQSALEPDDVLGLTVQWNAYATVYYNDPNLTRTTTEKLVELSGELIAKLDGGGFQPNPARGMLVGVIGLWRAGEPVHEPGGRTLIPSPNSPVATAFARVTGNTLVLDLSNSISETDRSLKKQDLGTLSVTNSDGQDLATFDCKAYDEAAYLATSGIVKLTVAGDASGDLQLRDAQGNVLLFEDRWRALPLVPNLYLNQADVRTAEFQVYDRGVPAGEGIEVTICVMSADGGTLESTFRLTTNANGVVSFPVVGVQGGILAYVALVGPHQIVAENGISPLSNTYMYVRTLPADEEIAQLAPTFENVYAQVLANWHAMAPCMDNWLDLGNEQQVVRYGRLILKLTDHSSFEGYRYMPVTRDLTTGQRSLLYNYLLKKLATPPPQQPQTMLAANDAAAETATEKKAEHFATRNRSMRSD